MTFIANFSDNETVKDFWTSANIYESYERMYSGTVFDSLCMFRKRRHRQKFYEISSAIFNEIFSKICCHDKISRKFAFIMAVSKFWPQGRK